MIDPTLLILYVALLGLPAFLLMEERHTTLTRAEKRRILARRRVARGQVWYVGGHSAGGRRPSDLPPPTSAIIAGTLAQPTTVYRTTPQSLPGHRDPYYD